MADGLEASSPVQHGRHLGQVLTALQVRADANGLIDWNVSVDSTINRAHQHATNTRPEGAIGGSVELQELPDRN